MTTATPPIAPEPTPDPAPIPVPVYYYAPAANMTAPQMAAVFIITHGHAPAECAVGPFEGERIVIAGPIPTDAAQAG